MVKMLNLTLLVFAICMNRVALAADNCVTWQDFADCKENNPNFLRNCLLPNCPPHVKTIQTENDEAA